MSTYTRDGVTRKLAVVSAGLGTPSSTRLLADRLADATSARLAAEGIDTERTFLELRDHAIAITGNLLSGFAGPELEAAVESLTGADGAAPNGTRWPSTMPSGPCSPITTPW